MHNRDMHSRGDVQQIDARWGSKTVETPNGKMPVGEMPSRSDTWQRNAQLERCTPERHSAEGRVAGEMLGEKHTAGITCGGETRGGETWGKGDAWQGSSASPGVTKESAHDVLTRIKDS